MIGIITLLYATFYNYGDVLQKFALYHYISKLGYAVEAIECNAYSFKNVLILKIYNDFHMRISQDHSWIHINKQNAATLNRNRAFRKFINEEIHPHKYRRYSKKTYKRIQNRYEGFIVGSDQVWNPYWAVNKKTSRTYFLEFAKDKKKISYAASFGVTEIPATKKEEYKKGLSGFDKISVREDSGADIVYELIGKHVDVLIDPTMLLDAHEWRKVSRKAKIQQDKPYILKYFLGQQSSAMKREVDILADQFGYSVYDLSDNENYDVDQSGPREFLYLIDHAALVYTDSFHATVFSIIKKESKMIKISKKDQCNGFSDFSCVCRVQKVMICCRMNDDVVR